MASVSRRKVAIRIFGLPSCDSCRAALRWAADRQLDCAFFDLRETPPETDTFNRWLAALGADHLINRRSSTWRGLDALERVKADAPDDAADLLARHTTLIKRPVIEIDDKVFAGFGPGVRARLEQLAV